MSTCMATAWSSICMVSPAALKLILWSIGSWIIATNQPHSLSYQLAFCCCCCLLAVLVWCILYHSTLLQQCSTELWEMEPDWLYKLAGVLVCWCVGAGGSGAAESPYTCARASESLTRHTNTLSLTLAGVGKEVISIIAIQKWLCTHHKCPVLFTVTIFVC